MYKIERKGILIDDVVIKEGEKEVVIHVDINLDDIVRDFDATWAEFDKLKQRLDNNELISEILPDYQKTARKLFTILFGDEAQKIFVFYGDRFMEMVSDFYPYITSVVIPKITEAQFETLGRYKAKKK